MRCEGQQGGGSEGTRYIHKACFVPFLWLVTVGWWLVQCGTAFPAAQGFQSALLAASTKSVWERLGTARALAAAVERGRTFRHLACRQQPRFAPELGPGC